MIENLGVIILIVIGIVLGVFISIIMETKDMLDKADKGLIYCKISDGIYGWISKEDFLRIVMTDHGEE
jgi:membrane-anchored glycerophosphoryl diester phosphodiesterase (GDPDase)